MLSGAGAGGPAKGFDTHLALWQVALIVNMTQIREGFPMPKEEWGVKRVCPTTGKRFYDLNKDPIVSPYTGEVVELETGKSRSIKADAEDAATKKAKSTEKEGGSGAIEEEDVEVELDDDLLDDEDDGNVSLDEIADVASDNDEG